MSHWKIIQGSEEALYFLTATLVEWQYVFVERIFFEIIINSLRHCQSVKELRIFAYVIMPNHLHLIASGTKEHPLSDTMRDFKQFTAKKIIHELQAIHKADILNAFRKAAVVDAKGNDYKIWTEGNHPIILENESMYREKLEYIHNNPVRKGFVEQPEHWTFSSARNYILNDHSVLKIECLY